VGGETVVKIAMAGKVVFLTAYTRNGQARCPCPVRRPGGRDRDRAPGAAARGLQTNAYVRELRVAP
jgi:hypothetical protein